MTLPFEIRVRIYYEDTDCGGVVYYANYLKYFERARTAHLEALGLDLVPMTREGRFFVVTSAEIQYYAPGRYGDTLLVQSMIRDIGGASLTFSHVVLREASAEKLVTGKVRLASVDERGRVTRFTPPVLKQLKTSVAT